MSAMTDNEQTELVASFAKRYGFAILVVVLIGVVGFLGWKWWQQKQAVTAANRTVQLQNLLNQSQNAMTNDQVYKKMLVDGKALIADNADSIQAVEAELYMAKFAFDKKDFVTANSLLTQAQNAKVGDEGLNALATIRLAYTQIAQNQLDTALKTLDSVKLESFIPSVAEAKGDIYVAKNDVENAKKAYQQAWDVLIQRQQPRQMLQLKLANLGVIVDMPKNDTPILMSDADDSASASTAAPASQANPNATQQGQ